MNREMHIADIQDPGSLSRIDSECVWKDTRNWILVKNMFLKLHIADQQTAGHEGLKGSFATNKS